MHAGILGEMAKLHNLGLYEFILHGSQFRQIGMGGGGGGVLHADVHLKVPETHWLKAIL